MKKIETIIFDLDGTLVNTIENLTFTLNKVLQEKGYPEHRVEAVKLLVGNGVGTLINKAVPAGTAAKDIEICLENFMRLYDEDMYSNNKVYDGMMETLKNLKNREIKIGVVSNKPDKETKDMCKHYFGDLVDIAYGEVPNRKRKPAPDGVLEAIKFLNGTVEKTIYVGDTKVDVETGKNAGLPVLGALWGYRDRAELEKAGADIIIYNPKDIISYLDKI